MPLKLDLDHARLSVQLSPFIFGKRITKRFKSAPSRGVVGFCRIPGSLTISEELPDKAFVCRQGDCEIVEFKHNRPTVLSVKRPAFLAAPLAECKHFVLALFSAPKVPTIARKRYFQCFTIETLKVADTAINAMASKVNDSVVTTLNGIQNYASIRILRPPSWEV